MVNTRPGEPAGGLQVGGPAGSNQFGGSGDRYLAPGPSERTGGSGIGLNQFGGSGDRYLAPGPSERTGQNPFLTGSGGSTPVKPDLANVVRPMIVVDTQPKEAEEP